MTISTELQVRGSLIGKIHGKMMEQLLRLISVKEREQLAAVALSAATHA